MLNAQPIRADDRDMEKIQALAEEAFPPEEYLAPLRMIEMAESDGFDFLALRDGRDLIGFMTVMTDPTTAYLFFLAIDRTQRSRGYGSQALRLLRAAYPGRTQVVDLERPDERAENAEQREKRRRFYLRSGYRATGQFLSYRGVSYEVLCADGPFDLDSFKALMKRIEIEDFAPVYFR